jgi:hypothetical protein
MHKTNENKSSTGDMQTVVSRLFSGDRTGRCHHSCSVSNKMSHENVCSVLLFSERRIEPSMQRTAVVACRFAVPRCFTSPRKYQFCSKVSTCLFCTGAALRCWKEISTTIAHCRRRDSNANPLDEDATNATIPSRHVDQFYYYSPCGVRRGLDEPSNNIKASGSFHAFRRDVARHFDAKFETPHVDSDSVKIEVEDL